MVGGLKISLGKGAAQTKCGRVAFAIPHLPAIPIRSLSFLSPQENSPASRAVAAVKLAAAATSAASAAAAAAARAAAPRGPVGELVAVLRSVIESATAAAASGAAATGAAAASSSAAGRRVSAEAVSDRAACCRLIDYVVSVERERDKELGEQKKKRGNDSSRSSSPIEKSLMPTRSTTPRRVAFQVLAPRSSPKRARRAPCPEPWRER